MEIAALRIEVERSRHETVELTFELPPSALDLVDDPEFEFRSPVTGHLNARMIAGETIHVRGEIRTQATSTCARCLTELPVPLVAPIDLMFFPEPSAFDRQRFARLEEDEKVYYTGDFLHPGEQLREELMINLPFIPACELEAGNICPVTGEKVEFPPIASGTAAIDAAESEDPAALPRETGNSLAAQLARVRKQMKKD